MPTAMSMPEATQFLFAQSVGRLGMLDGDEPYVVPISYAYRDGAVYCHSAPGRKVRALRTHARVCFEVDEVVDLSTWTSVVAWGTFQQLIGEEARQGMTVLIDRFRPMFSSGAGQAHPGAETRMMRTLNMPRSSSEPQFADPADAAVVYRIALDTMTGLTENPASI